MNCRINASARIAFRKLRVKLNFVFRQFNFFLCFITHSAKNVFAICHIQLQ